MAICELEEAYADDLITTAYINLLNARVDKEIKPYNGKNTWLRVWDIIDSTAGNQHIGKIHSVEGGKIYNKIIEICPQLEDRIKEELKINFPKVELNWFRDP